MGPDQIFEFIDRVKHVEFSSLVIPAVGLLVIAVIAGGFWKFGSSVHDAQKRHDRKNSKINAKNLNNLRGKK